MLPVNSSSGISQHLNEVRPTSVEQRNQEVCGRKIRLTQPSHRPKLTLNFEMLNKGNSIGRGLAGEVYKDPENPGYVIKRYNKANSNDAKNECVLFNRFYGEGSAEVFIENDRHCLRMLEVPGIPLTGISQFPEHADKMFLDMIIDMGECKIIHGDLHMGNILFDEDNGRFWPVDFSNSYESYHSLDKNSKIFANDVAEKDFCSILQHLRANARNK
ncbi:hypothetical protein IB385_004729 [Escherichia coli]|nr:hypothetical protein [Escherichia coli]EGF1779340.1 hypothetical protein [Escherichia coli]